MTRERPKSLEAPAARVLRFRAVFPALAALHVAYAALHLNPKP